MISDYHGALSTSDISVICGQQQRCLTVINMVSSTLYQYLFKAAEMLPHESSYTHNQDADSLP